MPQIHIIDPNLIRRNQIARSIVSSKYHAEIYDSFAELIEHKPLGDLIMAAEEVGHDLWAALSDGTCAMSFVIYGARPNPMDVAAAIRAGALDFLVWPQPDFDLKPELERLLADARRRGKALAQIQDAKRRVASLTAREIEVLRLLTQGNSNKQIGEEVGISPRTVEIHRGNALKKLNAQTSAEAVRIGICAGLDATLKVSW